jgi:sulfite reductase (NADPH) hemoprotein beta-component
MPQIVIANTLADGFVVFLTDNREWSGNVADAAVVIEETDGERLLEAALLAEKNNVVIDPYLIEVEVNGAGPKPVEYREYIRAFGPTVKLPADNPNR